jgi:hypothetical protein
LLSAFLWQFWDVSQPSARTFRSVCDPPGAKMQYEAATSTATLQTHQALFIG